MSSGASSTGGAPPILKLYVHTLFRGTGNTETLKRNVALLLCVHNKPMAIQSLARTCSVEKDVLRSTTQSDTSGVYAIDPATDTIDLHHDVLFHNGKAMLQHTVHCVWHPIDPAAWALNETATLIVQSQSLESPAASLFSINASQAESLLLDAWAQRQMWLEQDSPWGTHGSLAALAASDPCFSAVQTGQITLRFNILMQQYSDLEAQALQAQEEQTAAAAEAEAEAAAAQSSEQAVPTTATIVPSAPQAEAAKSVALQLIQKTGHSQAAADQGQHLTGSDGQQHVAAALNSPNELMAMAFRAGHEAGALAWASQAPFLYNAGAPKAPPPPSGDGSYGPMALGAGAGAGADPAPGADARQQGSAAESAYSAGSYNPIKPPMRSAHAYPNGTYSNSGDGPAGMVNQLAALVWGGRGLARQLRRTLCSLLLEADVPFGKAVRGQYPPRTLLLTSLSHKLMQQHKQLWRGYHWPRLREVLEDWKSGGIFAFSPYQSSSGGTGDFLIAIDSSALRSLTTDTLNQRASDVWSAGLEAEGNNSNSSHSLNTSWTGGRAGSSDVRLAAMARRAVEVITASTVELLALSLQAEAVHASLRGQALDQLNAQVAEAAMSHGLLPDLSVHSTTNSSGGGGGGISLGSGLRYSPWVVSAQRMEVELQHAWPRGFGALPAGGAVQMLEGDMTGLLQVDWHGEVKAVRLDAARLANEWAPAEQDPPALRPISTLTHGSAQAAAREPAAYPAAAESLTHSQRRAVPGHAGAAGCNTVSSLHALGGGGVPSASASGHVPHSVLARILRATAGTASAAAAAATDQPSQQQYSSSHATATSSANASSSHPNCASMSSSPDVTLSTLADAIPGHGLHERAQRVVAILLLGAGAPGSGRSSSSGGGPVGQPGPAWVPLTSVVEQLQTKRLVVNEPQAAEKQALALLASRTDLFEVRPTGHPSGPDRHQHSSGMHARLLLDGVQAAAAAKDVASTAGAYGAHASSTSNTASNTTDSGSTAGLAGRSDEDVMRYILTRPHQYMTRPGKALCRHYDSKGSCPFRNKCLYNHPHPREMHEAWLHAQVTREQATASKKASKAAASAAAVASANGGLARPNQALLSHALPGEGLQERASRAVLQQVASVGSTPLGNYTLPLRDVAAMLTRKRLLDTDNPRVTPEGQVQALVLGLPRLLRLEAHSLSGLSTVQLDVEAFNSTELQRQEAEDAVAAAIQSAGSGGGSGAAAGGEHPHPVRPHMRVCKHYARSGACPFGMKCHYNHPPPAAPVAAATAAAASAAAQAAAAQATTPAKAAMTATSTATSAAAAAASDLTTTSSSNAGAVSIPPVFGYDNKARARALAAQQYPGAASAQLNSPKRVRSSVMYQLACLPSGPLGPHTLSLKGLSVMLVKANAASQMEPEELEVLLRSEGHHFIIGHPAGRSGTVTLTPESVAALNGTTAKAALPATAPAAATTIPLAAAAAAPLAAPPAAAAPALRAPPARSTIPVSDSASVDGGQPSIASTSTCTASPSPAAGPYHVKPGMINCNTFVRTGRCRYGANCWYDHPAPASVISTDLCTHPDAGPPTPAQASSTAPMEDREVVQSLVASLFRRILDANRPRLPWRFVRLGDRAWDGINTQAQVPSRAYSLMSQCWSHVCAVGAVGLAVSATSNGSSANSTSVSVAGGSMADGQKLARRPDSSTPTSMAESRSASLALPAASHTATAMAPAPWQVLMFVPAAEGATDGTADTVYCIKCSGSCMPAAGADAGKGVASGQVTGAGAGVLPAGAGGGNGAADDQVQQQAGQDAGRDLLARLLRRTEVVKAVHQLNRAAPLLQAASGTHLLDWSSLTDTGLLLALCSALALGSSSGTGSIMSMLHAQAGSAPGLVSALLSVGQAAAAKELATASDAAAAALASGEAVPVGAWEASATHALHRALMVTRLLDALSMASVTGAMAT